MSYLLLFPINFLFLTIMFILGSCIGSFLNMAIYRVNKKTSFAGSSVCDRCKKKLGIRELIPIVSYFTLRGKCLCKKVKLAKSDIFVEISTAVLFLVISVLFLQSLQGASFYSLNWFYYNSIYAYIYYLVVASCLVFIFFYDFKFYEIPYSPVIITFVSWLGFNIISFYRFKGSVLDSINSSSFGKYLLNTSYFSDQIDYYIKNIYLTIFVAICIFIFILLLFLLTKGAGMGFGDVYTAPVLALVAMFPQSIVFLMLSFIFGAVYGVFAIVFFKAGRKSKVPFAPFMVLGLIASLTVGTFIANIIL